MDKFTLGLDVLPTYDAFVDLGQRVLRLGQEEVSMWSSQAQHRSSTLWWPVTKRYKHNARVVIAWLENPLGAESGLVNRALRLTTLIGLHSQDPSQGSLGGTCQSPANYPSRPDTNQIISHRKL